MNKEMVLRAIKYIKEIKGELQDICADERLNGEYTTEFLEDNIQKRNNCSLAIKALEKQIPKKPILVKDDRTDEKWWYECPVCKETMMEDYCCGCGQKMDWSDYEH